MLNVFMLNETSQDFKNRNGVTIPFGLLHLDRFLSKRYIGAKRLRDISTSEFHRFGEIIDNFPGHYKVLREMKDYPLDIMLQSGCTSPFMFRLNAFVHVLTNSLEKDIFIPNIENGLHPQTQVDFVRAICDIAQHHSVNISFSTASVFCLQAASLYMKDREKIKWFYVDNGKPSEEPSCGQYISEISKTLHDINM
jgi:hypothetical protein